MIAGVKKVRCRYVQKRIPAKSGEKLRMTIELKKKNTASNSSHQLFNESLRLAAHPGASELLVIQIRSPRNHRHALGLLTS